MRPHVAEHFETNAYYGGLTYNSHPLALAAALATIEVYEQDGLLENARKMGEVMGRHHAELAERHPSVGAVRNLGLFGLIELIRDRTHARADGPVQRLQRRDEGVRPLAARRRRVHHGPLVVRR